MFHRTIELLLLPVVLVSAVNLTAPSGDNPGGDYQGTVVSVDVKRNTIQTKNEQEQKSEFNLAENCKIALDDKDAALEDLVEGTTVMITIKKLKGKQVAVKILARSAE
jgi:hypothetical protein